MVKGKRAKGKAKAKSKKRKRKRVEDEDEEEDGQGDIQRDDGSAQPALPIAPHQINPALLNQGILAGTTTPLFLPEDSDLIDAHIDPQ